LALLRPRRRAWAVSWGGTSTTVRAAALQGQGGLAAQAAGAFDADAVRTAGERPSDQVGVAGWVVGEAGLGDGSAVGVDGAGRQGVFVRVDADEVHLGLLPVEGWPPGAAHTCVDPRRAAPIKRHHPA
jgi:hypothetical protein